MKYQWIPLSNIQYSIQLEPFIVGWLAFLFSLAFYSIFLKQISDKRHRNLKQRFFSTFWFMLISSVLSFGQFAIFEEPRSELISKIGAYFALSALVLSAISLIKLCQIYVYLYLFYSNMKQGVPRLIANMFTFAFSLFITSVIASNIFGIHLATLVATSAVFSLVLGLALQDTLGNLFAGIALQLDRPYQIGDWIEVHNGSEKWIGQVQEITWRATFLLSFSDEVILISNKVISQSQLLIYSQHSRSPRFTQTFRIPYNGNIELTKLTILKTIESINEVLKEPAPRVLLTETSDSWILLKVFYSINDFGMKFRVGDKVIEKVVNAFAEQDVKLASTKIEISKQDF